MAPKQWDYSGIMKGIAALGKYAASKKQIADELTIYGDAEINIKEMPPEMMTGAFGDQNAEFFPGIKQLWNESVTTQRKNPAFTKKYKQATKTLNTLKSSLEKNKADLLLLADIKTQINNNWQNRSAGISRESFHRIADLQISNSTKELDGNMMFTIDNGIQIYANDVVNMQTRAYSVNEFMDGFYENIMNKDNNNSDLKKIIKSVGEKRKNQDYDWKEDDARDMIRTFMTGLKNSKYGGNGIKSLAFDFDISAGGGTFVQANKNIFSNPELSGEDANTNYVEEYKKNNPEATTDEITLAYEHQASDVWDGSDSDVYESQIEDWLLGIAKKDYDGGQAKADLNKSSNKIAMNLVLNKDYSTMRADKVELANAAKAIKSKQSFGIDGSLFAWDKGAQQWVYQDPDAPKVKGKQKLSPVPATPDKEGSEGSAEALLFIFNNDPSISKALGFGDLEKPDLPIIKTEE